MGPANLDLLRLDKVLLIFSFACDTEIFKNELISQLEQEVDK